MKKNYVYQDMRVELTWPYVVRDAHSCGIRCESHDYLLTQVMRRLVGRQDERGTWMNIMCDRRWCACEYDDYLWIQLVSYDSLLLRRQRFERIS